jgi:chorismate mutase
MESQGNQSSSADKSLNLCLSGNPLIIAGPCSAETPEQLMQAATMLAMDGRVDYYRAGIWKPRSTPDSFQGMGVQGLAWLQEVKRHTGLKVATEVGSEKHVEEALKAGIDMLWIGARTTGNPFVMQEIADVLQGTDIPVMVKNPISPDLDLWIGAIKRLQRAGVKQVGAIHRGFYWLGKSSMRNQPFWHIPLELKNRMPEIPLICDPSHITGKREMVPLVAKRAMEHKFSGLMIEVHHDPDKAWSDAPQQITPHTFMELLNELFGNSASALSESLLDELRAEIDSMDEMLIWALSSRMQLAGKIAQVKMESGMESLQVSRWKEVLKHVRSLAAQSDIDPVFVEKLYNSIHQQSIQLQNTMLNSGNSTKKAHTFVF